MACKYPLCTSRRKHHKSKHVKVFTFPRRDKERAIQWAVNCGRPDLVDFISKGGNIASWNGICTLHFERSCFMNDLKVSLTRFAVPTIFQSKDETDTARVLHTRTMEAKFKPTIGTKKNGEINLEKAEWLNSNTNQLQDTVLNATAKPHCLLTHTNLSKSDHAADIDPSDGNQELYYADHAADTDPSDGNQELYYADGKSISSTANLPICKNHHLIQRPALVSVSENTSKELLCRLCARYVCLSQMVHIFGKLSSSNEYLRKIIQLLPSCEHPTKNDLLPKWICNVCCERLNYCDQAVHDFISASVKLKGMLPRTKQNQGVIHNFKLAEGQADYVVKQEKLEKEFFDFLLDGDTNQDLPLPNCANSQQIDYTGQVVSWPTSRQKKDSSKSYPAMSVFMDHNYDSLENMGLQCESSVLDKSSLFHHTSTAKHGIKILRKQLINDNQLPLESQDSSFSDSVLVGDIISPKEINPHLDDEITSTSVSLSPKLIQVESVNRVDSFLISERLMSNKQCLLSSSTSSSQVKKRRQISEQEKCHGKITRSSHTLLPTASDNKTFVCKQCNISFVSIESALTHRFKEHPEEDIFVRLK